MAKKGEKESLKEKIDDLERRLKAFPGEEEHPES